MGKKKIVRARFFLRITSFEINAAFCENTVFQKFFVYIICRHFRFESIRIFKLFTQRFGDNTTFRKVTATACTFLIEDKKYNN